MNKAKVLVVDDAKANRELLAKILSDIYEVEMAENGITAISKMLNSVNKPQLVLLDVIMPEMDGFQVMEFMKTLPDLKKIPIILTTASNQEKRGLSLGAVDYISKPYNVDVVLLRIKHQIELIECRQNLEGLVKQKADELLNSKQLFLNIMAQLIEHRSLESGDHVNRTRESARLLLASLIKYGAYKKEILKIDKDLFLMAVPLHDIGKVSVPDSILLKEGSLNSEEMEIMKAHSVTGAEVICQLKAAGSDYYLEYCHDICRYHHERWDGTGYPDKLADLNIPLTARIVAVVDVYDALVSKRCYKDKISHKKAMLIIKEGAGKQFDPIIAGVMLKEQEEFAKLYNSF